MHSTTVMTGRSTAREGVELLKEILASVDEVAAAYVAWNAASPGWTYGPQLAWEKGQWVPTWAALARTQVPLLSEKPVSWTAAPLAGLSAFRHAVQAEILSLCVLAGIASCTSVYIPHRCAKYYRVSPYPGAPREGAAGLRPRNVLDSDRAHPP